MEYEDALDVEVYQQRLEAAAPDLLAALRDLLAATDPTYDNRHECEAARAAIARATGGEQ